MIKTCEECGCVFDDGTTESFQLPRECPLCKLREEIPDMLEDLYDRIKEQGIYDPNY